MENMESSQSVIQPANQLDARSTNVTITTSALDGSTTPSPVSSSKSVAIEIDDHYDVSHPKHGIALVINQMNFSNMSPRDGSDIDCNSISSVLKTIGFDVRVIEDLKRKKLLAMLKTIASEDHSQNNCLVVVVLTHGKEKNRLYANDKSYKVSKLWEPFVGDACPSLVGKPKLFFIQACRGKKLDIGSRVKRMIKEPIQVPINYVIPAMADLLVMYSTCDGYYAWRNTDNGSWFIQSLSNELGVNAYRLELLHILTAVSRRVAYQYQSNVPRSLTLDAKKQMPCIVSMLTKLLYFPTQKPQPDCSLLTRTDNSGE
uniref:Caspase n=1 Tax=Anopheles funestus TaxID=62324 RepID=A0A182RXU3_ANOFN